MKEYWRVILYTSYDNIYAGSERFDAKWKAEQFIKEQKGRWLEHYAKLQHWQMQSEETIDIKKLT